MRVLRFAVNFIVTVILSAVIAAVVAILVWLATENVSATLSVFIFGTIILTAYFGLYD